MDRTLADDREKTERLRRAEFMLKTPRLHHKFIENYGVDTFIERFNLVLAEYEAIQKTK